MEKLQDLKDLLTHEIHDLVSAEDQILEAMPSMIEKAANPELKKALKEHLRITEMQRKRLDQVNALLNESDAEQEANESGLSGFLSKLFSGGAHKCKGMEGLITEGNKVMALDMNAEVLDAAIIACAQKIEHYEICGYGTARAYARELNLGNVAILLEETLNEEYAADKLLTSLALGGLNEKAELAEKEGEKASSAKSGQRPKNTKGASGFYGGGHGSKKQPESDTNKAPKKNISPNRRQVTAKDSAPGAAPNRSRPSGEGRPKSAANRNAAAPARSKGRPKAGNASKGSTASRGRSSAGTRGGAKGAGGGRGHK